MGSPPGSRRVRLLWGAGAIILYLSLATWTALTMRPLSDEAWFASPARSLIERGHLATTVLEPANPESRGIDRNTYWVMPGHLLVQAAWYPLVGFGLLPLRALSIVCGLATLASWFIVLRALTGRTTVGLLGASLLATDHVFVWASSVGRMDVLSVAFGSAALAVYATLRTRRLDHAVLAAASLAAAAAFTHPHGLLWTAALVTLALHLDRPRLGFQRVLAGLLPFALAGAGWGAYAARDPQAFADQFRGNVFGYGVETGPLHRSQRLTGLTAPWRAVALEIGDRYLPAYGLAADTPGPARGKAAILLLYVAGVGGCLFGRNLRRHPPVRGLAVAALLAGILLALFGFPKSKFYLVYVLPMFAATAAIGVSDLWANRPRARMPLALLVGAVVVVQVAVLVRAAERDDYATTYTPALEFVRQTWDRSGSLLAPSEFAFDLGFDGQVRDDVWLGYHSGRSPGLIVVYERGFDLMLQARPELGRHADELLQGYRVVFRNGLYRIYARR